MGFNKVLIFKTEPTVFDPTREITHTRITVENISNSGYEEGIHKDAPILPVKYFELVYKTVLNEFCLKNVANDLKK